MNPYTGFTKLIDIHDQGERLHVFLEKYLEAHSIQFRSAHYHADGFIRYFVKQADLCYAQAGLPALREFAEAKP